MHWRPRRPRQPAVRPSPEDHREPPGARSEGPEEPSHPLCRLAIRRILGCSTGIELLGGNRSFKPSVGAGVTLKAVRIDYAFSYPVMLGGAGLILAFALSAFFALGLRPLRRIAGDVAAIETGEQESLAGPYPRELEPLTRNLDRLLKTEKANQARYRGALDSLAHSLKTPLAVIHAGLPKSQGPEVAAMQEAVPPGKGAMSAVLGLSGEIVSALCARVFPDAA